MSTITRLLLPGVLLLSIFLFNGCGDSSADETAAPENVQAVEVTTVSQRDLTETLLVVGSIAANESAEVRSEISGLVRRIHFEEGQKVEEGDVLVQLDDRELQAQLREANVRFELAKQTFERSEALLSSQSVSQADRDRALADMEQTRAELDLLKVRVEKSVIRAPFAGSIGARTISPGDYISPSDSISRLEDLSRLKVDFAVPARHADRLATGATVRLFSGGRSESSFHGSVYFISPVIDRSTRSVQVKAYADDPPASLRPGTFIQVEVVLEEKKETLTVPETAILAREGGYFLIMVERDGEGRETAAFRPVRLGLRQEGQIEVLPAGDAGLAAGERVVAAGVGALPLFPGARLESRPMKSKVNESARS